MNGYTHLPFLHLKTEADAASRRNIVLNITKAINGTNIYN
jgi:hypothetical protein